MNPGVFNNSVDESWKIINNLHLAKECEYYPMYPSNPAALFRNFSYIEYWESCFNSHYYNFLLSDNSLIQFRAESYNPLKLSYYYIECPYVSPYFIEYIEELGYEIGTAKFNEDRESLIVEHNINTLYQDIKYTITPIRYDYDESVFNENIHPISHIHFGYQSDIRIGTQKILYPISFSLLILRQCYSSEWKQFLSSPKVATLSKYIRDCLDYVDSAHYFDEMEMVFY